MQQAESPTRNAAQGRIQAFEYQDGPDESVLQEWNGWAAEGEEPAASSPRDAKGKRLEAGLTPEFEHRLAEEARHSFEAGRERGRQEGRQAEREAQAASQAAAGQQRARQAAELIENFTQERERYLQVVEREVVKLALAVAARILRREAQMDPLLLTGAVRVALGQLSGSTQVRLRVPEAELALWSEAVALIPNLAVKPVLVAGEGMRLGDCMVETELGSVDLGIRSQLNEIERGFFDRAGSSKSESVKSETSKPHSTQLDNSLAESAEPVSVAVDAGQERVTS